MNETVQSAAGSRPVGVWTIDDGQPIIVDGDGPATILVPTESVRLLRVDLPLNSRAKRIDALPFAIEDRIAESPDSVHLALGEALAPKSYLVGVVAHDSMRDWVERAEEAGLGQAALVPDALALPIPPEGHWVVDLGTTRAVVRTSDGTGFAVAAALLEPAWERAGRPPIIAHDAPVPAHMAASEDVALEPLAKRLARPALDLRQGIYARSRTVGTGHHFGRRIAWILGLGAAAHLLIAGADTMMLRRIADRREAETRALVQSMAPGATLGDDISGSVADMIPPPGGVDRFMPLLTRVSDVLAPLAPAIAMRSIAFQGNQLVLSMDLVEQDAADQISTAMASSGIRSTVTRMPDGGLRITAEAA